MNGLGFKGRVKPHGLMGEDHRIDYNAPTRAAMIVRVHRASAEVERLIGILERIALPVT